MWVKASEVPDAGAGSYVMRRVLPYDKVEMELVEIIWDKYSADYSVVKAGFCGSCGLENFVLYDFHKLPED